MIETMQRRMVNVSGKDAWYVCSCADGNGGFTAWVSQTPLTKSSPVLEPPNVDIWFQRRNTREEAESAALAEVGIMEMPA